MQTALELEHRTTIESNGSRWHGQAPAPGPDPCEFDPAKNGMATRASGCPNQAEIIVGAGGRWRVCSSCAALPYFDILRKRVPIKAPTEPA
jgi:hypothetical protein